MAKWTRPRFLIMYALIPLVFLLAASSDRQFRIGVPVVLFGLFIRLWANGYVGHQKVNYTGTSSAEAKIGRLITAGPYAHVRHPLYVGTFVIALGIGMIVGHPLVIILGAVALVIIYRRKMEEEERTLLDECGEAFTLYKKSVASWMPSLVPYKIRNGQWSWQGIFASKEWKTDIWVLVFLIALYLREEIWQEHELYTQGDKTKHLIYLAILICLAATDGIIELMRRRRMA